MQKRIIILLLLLALALASLQAQPALELPHFLTLPVENCKVSEGWKYDDLEAKIHPSTPMHYAIDCRAKRGTPVYAAADGWAIRSFQTYLLPEKLEGKSLGFGLGNFVQICDGGICQAYAHLDRILEKIPFYPADKHEGLYNPSVVNRPFKKLLNDGETVDGKLLKPVFIRQGELIGYVGDSGLSWGYDEDPGPQHRDFKKYPTWDPNGTHLHFEVYDRNEQGRKRNRWDPFGLYGTTVDYQSGKQGPTGLFIVGKDGKPAFVRVR